MHLLEIGSESSMVAYTNPSTQVAEGSWLHNESWDSQFPRETLSWPSPPRKEIGDKSIVISDVSTYPVTLLGTDLHRALEAWERNITATGAQLFCSWCEKVGTEAMRILTTLWSPGAIRNSKRDVSGVYLVKNKETKTKIYTFSLWPLRCLACI